MAISEIHTFGKNVEKGEIRIADQKLVARSPERGESRAHAIHSAECKGGYYLAFCSF